MPVEENSTVPSPESGFSVSLLERGGKLIQSQGFVVQLGAYPETIKDTMTEGVPDLYLIPESLFDVQAGISAAELEFPLYYNYYLKRRKLRFICRPPQVRPLLRVLSEALFGPQVTHHHQEFLDGADTLGYPDLAAEMAWFKRDPQLPRGRMHLNDCLLPLLFDEEGKVEVDGTVITCLGNDHYRFERDHEVLEIPFEGGRPQPPVGPPVAAAFQPPLFGITIIGSGHGFDVSSTTSGFIIWVDGKGILVDPPVNSTAWLVKNGINTRLIEDIVLTHCHADHDSGTLQKILQEGRVNLHTTETVLHSFTRKYRALTGLSATEWNGLFNFSPVQIDQGVNIGGAEFRFKYRLHPIPTIGFEAFFQGQSFVYSSDTLYEPTTILKMHQEGVLSKSRTDDLLDFPWHHSLILHECGVPPIHTPLESLAALPAEIKARLYVTHISAQSIPAECGLRLAPPGASQTLTLDVPQPASSQAHKILDLLAHIDLFRSLRVDKAAEFLRITRYSKHEANEVIIKAGDPGEAFFMILSGTAEVRCQGRWLKDYARYDYFGEVALIANQLRTADIIATSELELLSIGRYDFLCFIRGTRLPNLLRRVAENRTLVSWGLLEEHRVLGSLSAFQQSQLLSVITTRRMEAGATVFRLGERCYAYYLVADGEVELQEPDGLSVRLGKGALLGSVGRDLEIPAYQATALAVVPSTLYSIPSEEMVHFFRANPGFYVRILQETAQGNPSYLV